MEFNCRAIIIKDEKIALIRRFYKEEYYVFPGGHLEENETLEECVIREVYEELGINIKVKELFYETVYNDTQQYFFVCEWISGDFGTGQGEEMINPIRGTYEPMLVDLKNIRNINLLPQSLRDIIVNKE
jgi:8-oxo-dGTP pyrophosphatase MutT (NUDIX family)